MAKRKALENQGSKFREDISDMGGTSWLPKIHISSPAQKAALINFKQNTIIKFVENPNIFHENYTL